MRVCTRSSSGQPAGACHCTGGAGISGTPGAHKAAATLSASTVRSVTAPRRLAGLVPRGLCHTGVVESASKGSSETTGGSFQRADAIDARFTLGGHLSRTLLIATVSLGLGVWLSWGASPLVWAALPVFWVAANLFEWATHRFPMHRPMQPRMMYRNHALVHHRAFAGDDAQEIQDVRELSVVMMPWYTILLVFFMASPLALVATLVGGPTLAGVSLISAISYFLLYETIHTLHHLPQAQLKRLGVSNWTWLTALRRHHHHHHRLENMAHTNFNVTAPLADWLFGTYYSHGSR